MTTKPEVWDRLAEKYTKTDADRPPPKRIPEPASAKRRKTHWKTWKTKSGEGAFYLPACAVCRMQFKHKPGCALENVMHLGRREKRE